MLHARSLEERQQRRLPFGQESLPCAPLFGRRHQSASRERVGDLREVDRTEGEGPFLEFSSVQ